MPKTTIPTVEYLRQRLRYEPKTGKLFWRECPTRRPQWNGRYAGREAFTAKNDGLYFVGNLGNGALRAHRVIWAMVTGAWPVDEIDHIDHDRSNNRIENLREVTRTENGRNTSKPKTNTSGVVGVTWNGVTGMWQAQIEICRKNNVLGQFACFDDAVAARKDAEIKHRFHRNHGN